MKTYKTREGHYVSEKPKEYFVGLDKRGQEVFIGDLMRDTTNRLFNGKKFKVDEKTWIYYINISVKITK